MKKFNLSLIALLFSVIFAGCQVFTTSFTPQEDSGIQVSKITLSETSVTLSGSRNAANRTITATASPSFAQDTTIYWESSDENIVGLSATTGSSVTLLLKGEGNATVTAKDYSGNASSTINVTCVFEKTPPFAVSNVNATAHANNVFFTWTDPTDYDGDLDHIEIVSSNGEKTSVVAGVQYGWVKNLTPGTEYTFTLTAYDANSNASSAVSASATTSDTVSEFTATEVSEPNITEKTATTFNLVWSAKNILANEEKWNHIDVNVANNSDLDSTIFYTEEEITVPFTNLTENTEYQVTINVYNDDFVLLSLSETIKTDYYLASLVRDESVTKNVSGYIAVKLEDIVSDVTYSTIDYVITAADNSSVNDITSQTSTNAEWTNLSLDVDYTIYAKFIDSSSNVVGTSKPVTLQATKVLWHLLSGYSSGRYVCRNICSTVPNGYTVGAITSGISTQEYWIVHSSLTGSTDYYSLESTDANGTPTGYYMYLDTTGRAQDSGENLWTSSSSYTNKLQVATLDESYITSSRKDASFKLGSSTVKTDSGWYRLYDENLGYYIVHASLVFGGVAASTTEDTAGCAAVYIETSYIN